MQNSEKKPSNQGFSFFEILIVMAIIAIMTGVGLSSMPRILTGEGLQTSSRQLMGKMNDARVKAMLEQRPWEIAFNLKEQSYQLMPLGTIKQEANLQDLLAFNANPFTFLAADTIKGDIGLKSSINPEIKKYTLEDDLKKVEKVELPEQVKIVRILFGDTIYDEGNLSLSFSPRGMNKNCIVWLEDSETQAKSTIYLPGLLAPTLHEGHLNPAQLSDY